MEAKDIKVGQRVICNGYEGFIREVCAGQLSGMAVVKVPGGLTCVDIKELQFIHAE